MRQRIHAALCPVAISSEEDQEAASVRHAIRRQQEQKPAPQSPPDDEDVDRAYRGSAGKDGEIRRLGSLFDLLGGNANWRATVGPLTDLARRREFDGEKVPNDDKVFSIFEPHTELIKRGRRGRPVEFGHKVLLTQSKEKFITDYVVLEKNRPDEELLPLVIERHHERYGSHPESVAADKGFCPDEETYEDLEEELDYLGVPRRTRDFGDTMMGIWQRWRAGIEGTISCLKRAFRLARCCFRGFKNFASAIGSAVFCHNLTVLAKTSTG